LGPSCSDFDAADEDAVAGSVFAAGTRIGNDADILGLEGKGDDLAAEDVAGFLEGADSSHCRSPDWVVEAAPCDLDSGREAPIWPTASLRDRSISGGRCKADLLFREECGTAAGEEVCRAVAGSGQIGV